VRPADPIRIGLLGCGVVGSGVVRLLHDHADQMAGRVGARLELGPVAVRDTGKPRGVPLPDVTGDPWAVVKDPAVDIVVEVLGGVDPARGLVAAALERGTSVVSANKTLVASAGPGLADLARSSGARFEYEAAVAGGVPVIKPMRESLAGDRVRKVLGILNGTTNYVLTRMTDEGVSFEAALAEAQHLGYAEADPSADVGGDDAAAKAAILASIAFDARVTAGDVHREGITGITPTDIAHARRLGYVIKPLAIAEEIDGGVSARVHPGLVPKDHPLANVRGVYNAVFVAGDAVGNLMFYGQGAGSLPTASAVLGDVVSVARGLLSGERPPPASATPPKPLRPFEAVSVQSYVLLDVADEPGVLAAVASAFGAHDVSIRSVWQEGRGDTAQLLLITHAAREGDVRATLTDLRRLRTVRDIATVLRVEGSEV